MFLKIIFLRNKSDFFSSTLDFLVLQDFLHVQTSLKQ